MWKYVKTLEYPVNIKKKDLRMAKYLVTQYGGANGELAAAWRYLNQDINLIRLGQNYASRYYIITPLFYY